MVPWTPDKYGCKISSEWFRFAKHNFYMICVWLLFPKISSQEEEEKLRIGDISSFKEKCICWVWLRQHMVCFLLHFSLVLSFEKTKNFLFSLLFFFCIMKIEFSFQKIEIRKNWPGVFLSSKWQSAMLRCRVQSAMFQKRLNIHLLIFIRNPLPNDSFKNWECLLIKYALIWPTHNRKDIIEMKSDFY